MLQDAFSAETYQSAQRTISPANTIIFGQQITLPSLKHLGQVKSIRTGEQTKRPVSVRKIPPGSRSCCCGAQKLQTNRWNIDCRLCLLVWKEKLRAAAGKINHKLMTKEKENTRYTHQTDCLSGLAWRRDAARWSPRHSACNYPKQTASSEERRRNKKRK